jgi:DNA repair protein SbcC/Rad50
VIPKYLRLSGFLSYKETVELDFTQFRLACVSGSNGAGKSSLLDAITWALFGQARRRDDSLIYGDGKTVKDAEVIFEFYYETSLYRVQRSKVRNKSTVLEFFVSDGDGNWKTLTEASVRETEGRIQRILRMDYDTFINASFFLQGKADQFAQQRPADRKRILASILGLEVWEVYRERAVERRKQIEIEQANISGQLEEIQSELKEEDVRKARLAQLEDALTNASALRQAQEKLLENLRRLAASVTEQRRLVEVLSGQEKGARQRLEDSREKLAARKEECLAIREQLAHAAEIEAAYQDWQETRKQLTHWETVASNFRQHEAQRSAPLMAIESERSRLEQECTSLLAQQRTVQEQESFRPRLQSQLIAVHTRHVELSTRLEQRPALEKKLLEIQDTRADARASNDRMKAEMGELKERIERLKQASGVTCPLCGQPLSTEDRFHHVEELETLGKEKGDLYRANQEWLRQSEQLRKDAEVELVALRQVETQMNAQQREADKLALQETQIEQLIVNWQAGGAVRLQELTGILETRAYAVKARAELASIDAVLRELGYDAAAHDAARRAEQAGRISEEHLRELEANRARLEPLEREVPALEQQVDKYLAEAERQRSDLQAARAKYEDEASHLPDLDKSEAETINLREQENRLRTELGGAVQKVEVLKNLRQRQKTFNDRLEEIKQQVTRLKILERAFSKDGVPALLIEQALPEIEEQANKILEELTDNNMSVYLETQKDYKDNTREDKKETLNILVSDSVGSREYELCSGGEAFRVNFAIRLALSRMLTKRAGARMQMLVIDEGFGSQDAEGLQHVVEVIKQVQYDFATILVITHLEELKDAFPARIEVEKTANGSQLKVVA